MIHFSSLLVALNLCLVTASFYEGQHARCVGAKRRVQCGFPGIKKHKCLQDCNCCFDANADEEDVQCFYKVPPKRGGCCDIRPRKRIACRVSLDEDLDLDEEPYLCRRLGCCYDGSGTRSSPRCYETKQDCCQKQGINERVDAALTHITRRQCSRIPGTCFNRRQEPYCYYKFPPCRCEVSHHNVKPCFHKRDLNKDPFKCLKAGCCFNFKYKCHKPAAKRSRSAWNSQSEGELQMLGEDEVQEDEETNSAYDDSEAAENEEGYQQPGEDSQYNSQEEQTMDPNENPEEAESDGDTDSTVPWAFDGTE